MAAAYTMVATIRGKNPLAFMNLMMQRTAPWLMKASEVTEKKDLNKLSEAELRAVYDAMRESKKRLRHG